MTITAAMTAAKTPAAILTMVLVSMMFSLLEVFARRCSMSVISIEQKKHSLFADEFKVSRTRSCQQDELRWNSIKRNDPEGGKT
jgi:hypothetical protein